MSTLRISTRCRSPIDRWATLACGFTASPKVSLAAVDPAGQRTGPQQWSLGQRQRDVLHHRQRRHQPQVLEDHADPELAHLRGCG
jgi:hypothetical protein